MYRTPAQQLGIATAAFAAAMALAVPSALARPLPGDPVPLAAAGTTTTATPADSCPLERVGHQFVRCDVLTGNGVPAPGYIPARG